MNKPETARATAEEYLRRISSWDRLDFYFKEAHHLRDLLRLDCDDRFVDENAATLEEICLVVGLACQSLAVHYERIGEIMRREEQADQRGDPTYAVDQAVVRMYADSPWLLNFAPYLSHVQIHKMAELYQAQQRRADDT